MKKAPPGIHPIYQCTKFQHDRAIFGLGCPLFYDIYLFIEIYWTLNKNLKLMH